RSQRLKTNAVLPFGKRMIRRTTKILTCHFSKARRAVLSFTFPGPKVRSAGGRGTLEHQGVPRNFGRIKFLIVVDYRQSSLQCGVLSRLTCRRDEGGSSAPENGICQATGGIIL